MHSEYALLVLSAVARAKATQPLVRTFQRAFLCHSGASASVAVAVAVVCSVVSVMQRFARSVSAAAVMAMITVAESEMDRRWAREHDWQHGHLRDFVQAMRRVKH